MKEEVSCDRKRKLVLRGISVPFSAAGGSGPILRPFHTRFPAFPSLRGKPAPLSAVFPFVSSQDCQAQSAGPSKQGRGNEACTHIEACWFYLAAVSHRMAGNRSSTEDKAALEPR